MSKPTPRCCDPHETVRRAYGALATGADTAARPDVDAYAEGLGYSPEELAAAPEGANLGLGCGNPTALAGLRPGDVVVDLGSGAGFDAFLASERVGPTGRVIGVDMTDEMLARARANARKLGRENVEFRKGLLEDLPLEDASADVVISNCVINLCPDKARVFAEAHRVLRPGGRLFVSDVVLERPLPEKLREPVAAYVGCISGSMLRADYLATVQGAGFTRVRVLGASSFGPMLREQFPELAASVDALGLSAGEVEGAIRSVLSVKLAAERPGADG